MVNSYFHNCNCIQPILLEYTLNPIEMIQDLCLIHQKGSTYIHYSYKLPITVKI